MFLNGVFRIFFYNSKTYKTPELKIKMDLKAFRK